jgi:hypothetical protein
MKSLSKVAIVLAAAAALGAVIAFALYRTHTHTHAASPDGRVPVEFPPMLKEHTLASMRDHLHTISRIQSYLAAKDFDRAAHLAEERLGMSSLPLHGAHDVAPYMPQGMQDAGTAMHRAASRFAVTAQEAAIEGGVPRALEALNQVTKACVACHAGYRLE